jgi:hypothetical protein
MSSALSPSLIIKDIPLNFIETGAFIIAATVNALSIASKMLDPQLGSNSHALNILMTSPQQQKEYTPAQKAPKILHSCYTSSGIIITNPLYSIPVQI